jgi:acyl carrier protein
MNVIHADIDAIKRLVIDIFSASCADLSVVTDDTEVMQLVDSVGLIIALADVQNSLDIELYPHEIIEVFQGRTLGDVAVVLLSACLTRKI